MEPILDFGLNVTRWLQTTYPYLAAFFEFISRLGETEFYLGLFPLVLWCLDKRLGKHLGYMFLLAVATNSIFKAVLRGPRPFWLDSALGLYETPGYGVPSGHAQLTAVIYPFIAAWIKKRWMTILAIFMVVAMSISRVYLGSHFVHDSIAGLLLAAIMLLGYFIWQRRFAAKFDNRILGQKLLVVMAVPVGIALIYTIARLIIGEPDTAVAWSSYIPEAEQESIEAVATSVGTLLGLGLGLLFEASRVRFKVDGPIWKRALRYLVGMIGAVFFWYGLGQIFPDDPLWLAVPLRILRYFLTTLWVSYYAPYVFVKLKLADAEPDPGINLSLRPTNTNL
jgi:membrane-associated phospholipid phosphatase